MRALSPSAAAPAGPGDVHGATIARSVGIGLAAIAIFVGVLGSWSVFASISGAVIAPAQVVVESNLKKVQHPTGGVVAALQVKDGDMVQAGDLLLRLDDTNARTAYEIVARQFDEAMARIARLEAERDKLQNIRFPLALTLRSNEAEVQAIMATERRLMEARAASRDGVRNQLNKRASQIRAEIRGATGQLAAKTRESETVARELQTLRGLHQRNLVPAARLNQLEREAAALEGQAEAFAAQIALGESRLAETELQMLQVAEDLRSEVQRDIHEAQSRLGELVQRRAAAEDQLRRVELRAPADGQVHQLAVHTVGGVLNPAEPAMLIVPVDDQLHVEARVSPGDYDQIHVDQPVRVRLHSIHLRQTPEIDGSVVRMSGDVARDPLTGAPFYVVRVAIPDHERARIAPLTLKAGMQADVFFQTGERSPASFLLKPFVDQLARALRE
jgi:HlyD family secretion protein